MTRVFLALYSVSSRAVCGLKSGLVRRKILKPRQASIPVVSVGNLTLGGSEKTPLVMELISYVERLGFKPALVSRGYRGAWEKSGGILSDGKTVFGAWIQAGDEPVLVAHRFPKAGVFVGKNRRRSCQKALDLGFDVAILDDGFQHIKLARDLDIVLHDDRSPSAYREGFPALRRADILLWKTGGRGARLDDIRRKCPGLDIFEYRIIPKGFWSLGSGQEISFEAIKGREIFAFCGIARPGRFFALLEESGLTLKARTSFPDHFSYPPHALSRLGAAYRESGAKALVTTEKDAVKLEDRDESFSQMPVYVLRIGLDLPAAFFDRVRDRLPRHEEIQPTQ
jgi:tetraacyldisaccharide 4'-kinase